MVKCCLIATSGVYATKPSTSIDNVELQLQKYEEKCHELQAELQALQDRNKLTLTELSNREEELMIHKVELSSLIEKTKIRTEEASDILKFFCDFFSAIKEAIPFDT